MEINPLFFWPLDFFRPVFIRELIHQHTGQTDGSIVIPRERNNIVGVKPTVGLTSRYLVVPVSEHQDTIGPMARTVKDAAKLLQIISGRDLNDTYTDASPFKYKVPNYLAACKLSGLRGKRIGVARNVIDAAARKVGHVMEAFEHAIFLMADAGATIIEDTNFTAYSQWKKREYNPVTRMDFDSNLAEYLSKLERNPRGISNVEDLPVVALLGRSRKKSTHHAILEIGIL